jgi:hypothetical protein
VWARLGWRGGKTILRGYGISTVNHQLDYLQRYLHAGLPSWA